MKKINLFIIFFILLIKSTHVYSSDDFEAWKKNFKTYAKKQGISTTTVNYLINNSKFLPNVIKYDRYQPEFYEDTRTYISKRTSKKKSEFWKDNL